MNGMSVTKIVVVDGADELAFVVVVADDGAPPRADRLLTISLSDAGVSRETLGRCLADLGRQLLLP